MIESGESHSSGGMALILTKITCIAAVLTKSILTLYETVQKLNLICLRSGQVVLIILKFIS